jgi:signal transduction histidine kinase
MRSRVGIVKGEIGRLERLLTEFLELARPRGLQREPVDLGLVLGEVIDLELEAIIARGITLEREIEPGCVALGDVEKLKQVVLNLVVNALEAMKEGGVLTARVRTDAGYAWLHLDDTGPGIEPAVLAQVFDPFFTTKEGGTGLGLSIVRKIIDQHAGDIRIDSARGKGASVTIQLPSARRASDA